MKQAIPSPSRARRGAARPLVLVLGAAVVAAGGLLAYRGLSSDEPRPAPPREVLTARPAAPEEPPAKKVAPADLMRPEDVPDTRPRGPFAGTLIDDATEEPIASYVVRAHRGPRPADDADWVDAEVWRTETGGKWTLHALEPGTYTLRVEARGYETKVLEDLEYPSPLGFLELRMEHGSWVHGHVRTEAGTPVADLALRLVPQSGRGPDAPQETTTDEAGRYVFAGVPEGRWRVELSGLSGVLKDVPTSPEWNPAERDELVWDPTLAGLTTVELDVKLKTKRFVFAPMRASLESTWGGRVEVPLVNNESARFPFVEPGVHELVVERTDGSAPWLTEFVEIPASETPLTLFREIVPPERVRPQIDVPKRGKKGGRKGGGQRR